jgi:hypothetical protein
MATAVPATRSDATGTLGIPSPVVEGPIPATAVPGDPSRLYPFLASPIDLASYGYVEEEFFISSDQARRFTIPAIPGDATVAASDGVYKTRIIVRRPAAPEAFNGTVLLEWQNVTALYDVDHYWLESAEHIMREGYAWVGVSAQRAGVHPLVAICAPAVPSTWPFCNNLRTWSPARYGTLSIPSDDWSYDIFAQAGKAVRSPSPSDPAPLGDLEVYEVIALGTSQSAGRLGTYYNSIQPLHAEPVIDAFFLGEARSTLRTDLDTPVLRLLSEVDVAASFVPADSASYRHWEVAGASHADFGFTSKIQELIERDDILQATPVCNRPAPSMIPKRYTYHAAWDHMVDWVVDGTLPPVAPRIQFSGGSIVRDADGNALGGIRLSEHAVATAYNGTGNGGGTFCSLFGVHEPFSAARLMQLYRNHGRYVMDVAGKNTANRNAGFLVPADSEESTANAAESTVGN